MRILLGIAIAVGALLGLALLVIAGARFADGPVGPIPGGALRAGAWVAEPDIDWTFAEDEAEIELQLVRPERSRTVWLVVHERQGYVPCSLEFPPFKTWHQEALRDGRAVVRVRGRRYERQLARVTDEELVGELTSRLAAKYRLEDRGPVGPDRVWFFRLDPRR